MNAFPFNTFTFLITSGRPLMLIRRNILLLDCMYEHRLLLVMNGTAAAEKFEKASYFLSDRESA